MLGGTEQEGYHAVSFNQDSEQCVCNLPLAVFRNWDKIREWHTTQQVQRTIPPQARTLSVSRGDLITILNN